MNRMKTIKQLLKVRVSNTGVMLTILTVFVLLFMLSFLPHNHRGSDRAACIMWQRNIQQAVRAHAEINFLNIGDPIEWGKIIGPGQYMEAVPSCPIHGTGAYSYSPTIPPVGVLAAPCKDIAHKPTNMEDW